MTDVTVGSDAEPATGVTVGSDAFETGISSMLAAAAATGVSSVLSGTAGSDGSSFWAVTLKSSRLHESWYRSIQHVSSNIYCTWHTVRLRSHPTASLPMREGRSPADL